MAGKLAQLWVEVGAKLDKFNKGMSDVENATVKIGKKLEGVGKQMTMKVTLPLLALGGAAVKMSADFDKGMTESLAIMGDVSPAMRAEMEKTAKQMSEESTFASKALAGSYFFLASAGMDAAQSIKALPVVTKFAQAGAFDLATATDLLTDAQTALGLSSKNAEKNQKNLLRVSDVLVKANTLANASVQQFSESLTNRAAPALRTVGKDIEEGVAVLAAFADQGRKGGEAGEALSIVMRDLQRAAIGNKTAFKEAGVTVYDASGEMVNMADIIGDLENLFVDMSDEQKKSTMTMLGFQERSQANILTLIGMSDKIRTYEAELRKAGGTTERVSKKQLEAFSNQMTILKNKLMNVGIQIGDILIPIIKDLVEDYIEPAVKWFSNLSEGSKIMTIKFAGIAAATGPLLYGFAKVLIILPKLRRAFALMTGPIGIMIAAATTLGIVLSKVIDDYAAKQDAEMDAMVEAAKGAKQFWDFRRKLIEEEIISVEEFKVIYEKHGRNYQRVMRAMATLPEYKELRDKWEAMQKQQKEVGESTEDLEKKYKGLFDDIGKGVGELPSLVKTMTDEIKKATLDEYEYRRWAADQIYADRVKVLEGEKGSNADFVLAKKAWQANLAQIEKDQTTAMREESKKRGEVLDEGMEDVAKFFDAYEERLAEYSDISKQYTMKEFDYKKQEVEEWYKREVQTLEELYGKSELFTEAMLELWQAYTAKMKALDEEKKLSGLEAIYAVADATANLFTQIGALSQTHYDNELRALENQTLAKKEAITEEYEDARKAIEDSIMSEEEKTTALLALEQKKNAAIEKMDTEAEREKKKIQKKAFESQKKISLITAAINIGEAITKALTGAIPPWNFILAGLVTAAGAIQLAAIGAQQFPSAQEGAWVPRPMPVMAGHGPKGEIIASPQKMKEIFAEVGAGIGGGATIKMNVYFYGDISNVGDLDQISNRLAEKTRRAMERGRK